MQRTTWTAALLLDAVILPTHPANEQAGLAELGLRLAETKQLTAALQAEMVSAQVARVGERRRVCVACGRVLASKGLTQHRCYQPQSSGVLLGQTPARHHHETLSTSRMGCFQPSETVA